MFIMSGMQICQYQVWNAFILEMYLCQVLFNAPFHAWMSRYNAHPTATAYYRRYGWTSESNWQIMTFPLATYIFITQYYIYIYIILCKTCQVPPSTAAVSNVQKYARSCMCVYHVCGHLYQLTSISGENKFSAWNFHMMTLRLTANNIILYVVWCYCRCFKIVLKASGELRLSLNCNSH